MAEQDPKSPMTGPRKTDDVMQAAPSRPAPESDAPEHPATDKATQAVEVGQEDA